MQFVDSRASSTGIVYSNRPAYSSPLSYYSSTFSDPPSSPPSLTSSSGMSSSSPYRDSIISTHTIEEGNTFQRRRQNYKSNVPSRRSRQASSASPSPQDRFRRQTIVRIQDDRAKIVNNKRNGCGRDAIRTGLETAEELAVMHKMYIGDAQERILQADPELNQMWEAEQLQAQDDGATADQESYLDVIYEEEDMLEMAEQYEEMQKEATLSYEGLPDVGRAKYAKQEDSGTNHVHSTDMDMDIEDYLDDDSIFEAVLERTETVSVQKEPNAHYDSYTTDMQE